MTNYQILRKAEKGDNDTPNWIHVKDMKNNRTGIAILTAIKETPVKVFMESETEENDECITEERFDKEFEITKITDHWNKDVFYLNTFVV